MTQPRVLIGAVIGAHGVAGEVKVKSFAAEPRGIGAYGPVQTEDGRVYAIAGLRPARADEVILRLDGVDTRNGAEALKGQRLYVARAALPEPEAGEYYHADLVGLRAEDASGREIGRVSAVVNYGAGDILEITTAAGETEFIPFTDACVPVVDLTAGRMVVDPPATDDGADGP